MSKRAILSGVVSLVCLLLLAGTVYLLRTRLHYFADQYIEPTYPNLTTNSGFETDIATSWSPLVQPAETNGTIATSPDNCPSGNCLVITPKEGNTSLQISQAENLEAGKSYLLTAKFKGTPYRGATPYFESASSHISSAGSIYPGVSDWRDIRFVYTVAKTSTASDWKIRLSLAPIPAADASQPVLFAEVSNTPVYLDDVKLNVYDDMPPNCINDADARCLDFGADNEAGNTLALSPITFNSSLTAFTQDDTVMTAKGSEGAVTFRNLEASKKVYIHIPAFNVDSQGLPLSPMLLNINYKVSEPYSLTGATIGGVTSYLGYKSNSTSFNGGSNPLSIVSISDIKDLSNGNWQDNQFAFANSPFPLIHAVDGYFTFTIEARATKNISLNSVVLRTLSAAQSAKRSQKIQDLSGLTTISSPTDNDNSAGSLDANPTVYTRDPLDPIYKETRPKASEIDKPIATFGTLNTVEPVSIGLYSTAGITSINADISDLKKEDGSDSIAAANIDIRHVVTKPDRVQASLLTSHLLNAVDSPDYLEEFSTINISAGTSERIWFNISLPTTLKGGVYKGNIRVLRLGSLLKEIPVSVEVLALQLDSPTTTTSVYYDPNFKLYATDQASVLKYFKDYQLSPYLLPNTADIITQVQPKDASHPIGDSAYRGLVSGFDSSLFESHLDGLVTAGVIKKGQNYALSTRSQWQDIYTKIFSTTRAASINQDTNLYSALRDSDYQVAFNLYLDKMETIAKNRGINFIYDFADEPCDSPYLRIVGEALTAQMKAKNLATATAYSQSCQSALAVPANQFVYPLDGGSVPPLTTAIDYKVWSYGSGQDYGFSNHSTNYSFDTGGFSQLRNPVYNRFAQGFYAYSTAAKLIRTFAVGDFIKDPFDDFDGTASDAVLGYPNAATGEFMPTMAAEGLREGIKDSQYLATIDRLIVSKPTDPVALQISAKLSQLKARVSPYLYKGYAVDNYGQFHSMVETVSANSDENDYAAFTDLRKQMFDAIKTLEVPTIESINISEGQIITTNPYFLSVKVTKPSSVIKVEFYVDDVLIGTSTMPDINGIFEVLWDTSRYHSTVKAIVYDNQGQTEEISRVVTVSLPVGSTTGTGTSGSDQTATSGSSPAITILPKTGEGSSWKDKASAWWENIKNLITK